MGVCRERATDKRRREWSNTEIVKHQITAPAQPATVLHPRCNASTCLRQTAIRASPLATIRSSQGPFTSLGPLFRSELPMDRANLLVPQCLFLTHSLAPLAVFPDLHPSRSRAAQLAFSLSQRTRTRTVRCAMRYLVYIPYLSPRLSCPACHLLVLAASICCTFQPKALFLSPLAVALLVSSCLAPYSHQPNGRLPSLSLAHRRMAIGVS